MSEERTLYECCYILDVNMPEEQVNEIIALSEGVVAGAGGEVVGTRDFGSRRLAYEIDKHVAGAYKLLYFHGDNEAIDALKHELAVAPSVIRARVFVANPDAILRDSEDEATDEGEETTAEESAEAPVEEPAVEAEATESSDE
jgi:small subunit ribosomal protein S6